MKCRLGQCDVPATFAVCLRLYQPGEPGLAEIEATECVTELNVCAGHAKEIDGGNPFALELLNARGWQDIIAGFLAQGRRPPARERSIVTVKPIDDPLVTGFRRQM